MVSADYKNIKFTFCKAAQKIIKKFYGFNYRNTLIVNIAGNKNGIRLNFINALKDFIHNKLLVFYKRKLSKFFTKMKVGYVKEFHT